MLKLVLKFLFLVGALSLFGCGQDESAADKAPFSLEITDAPVDGATKVVIEFTGVEIQSQSNGRSVYEYAEPRSIDLLSESLAGNRISLLQGELGIGAYSWLRLMVNARLDGIFDSYIELADGSRYELAIPEDNLDGLKIDREFLVSAGQPKGFLIDLDLRRSIIENNRQFKLKPVLKTVDLNSVRSLTVNVAPELLAANCDDSGQYAGAIYMFAGAHAVLDDIDGDDKDPVATAVLSSAANPENGMYKAVIWNPDNGAYRLAYSCNPKDNPELNDQGFSFAEQTVTVVVVNDDGDKTATLDASATPL